MQRVAVHGIDHVTVAVRSLESSSACYESLFASDYYAFDDPSLQGWGGGATALSADGVQLVQAECGEMAAWVERCGEAGLAIGLRVPEIASAAAVLRDHGLRPVGEADHDRWRAVAFDPADTFGVMLKVIEYLPGYSVADLEIVRMWREMRGLEARPRELDAPMVRARGVDHVLVYVGDIDGASHSFSRLLTTEFPSPHPSATGSYLAVDGIGIELISSEIDASGVNRFLRSRASSGSTGEGIAAISFLVDDWDEAVAAMAARGAAPYATRDLASRRVALYGPSAGIGVGVELIEYRRLAHPAVAQRMVDELRALV